MHLKVKDIVDNGVWHFERLETQLPQEVQLHIKSIFCDGISDDVIIWSSSTTSSYAARCGYHFLNEGTTDLALIFLPYLLLVAVIYSIPVYFLVGVIVLLGYLLLILFGSHGS